jgi:hypothetical protein
MLASVQTPEADEDALVPWEQSSAPEELYFAE